MTWYEFALPISNLLIQFFFTKLKYGIKKGTRKFCSDQSNSKTSINAPIMVSQLSRILLVYCCYCFWFISPSIMTIIVMVFIHLPHKSATCLITFDLLPKSFSSIIYKRYSVSQCKALSALLQLNSSFCKPFFQRLMKSRRNFC